MLQPSSRSVLTIIGTALGIGGFVAILGVTETANGQITKAFTELSSTVVIAHATEEAVASPDEPFPADARTRVSRISGVTTVAEWRRILPRTISALPPGSRDAPSSDSSILAVSPEYWDYVGGQLGEGRFFDEALSEYPVAVVGRELARSMSLAPVETSPTIYINRVPVTVIGIAADTRGDSALLSSIAIPHEFAIQNFASDVTAAALGVNTRVGASTVVSEQLALAINPQHPDRVRVVPPPKPSLARNQVAVSVQTLLFSLACITLLVGAVGITNSALIGVLSRAPEIGLRRALGAMPRHIALQFVLESAIRGLLGGAIGTAVGVLTVVVIAAIQQWTPVLHPLTLVLAPIAGLGIGCLAGAYPAWKAARLDPLAAFRTL
ncbi:putative ABC transport system permease protein [Leucobacter luti]|uniref:Putative ABC transport system permease protein n=1 Tax=Leucobacter luti TaxID=340320 RepID=A0A4R6RWZ5_9MICO|nr:ABC transporter permease [Leucobacter luti]TDP91579.1 putative ABC transport system permease protein [Leucobacter luti]